MKYINVDQLNDEKEHLRVINLINDDLNNKPLFSFTTTLDDTLRDITGIPAYGAFLMIIYGVENDTPTGVYALSKSNQTIAGHVSSLDTQSGVNAWDNESLEVESTTSYFQIRHTRTGVSADFNITILGVF